MKKKQIITDMCGIVIEPTYFDLQHHDIKASEIIKIVKNIGANAVRIGMFSHQGHAYYPSKIAPKAPFLKRDLLKEFSRECKKQSIRLIVYLNSKWVTDLYKEHPEWRIMMDYGPLTFEDMVGHTKRETKDMLTIYPMCPNSPFMNTYFIQIIKEIVSFSNPDAVYIDNFAIHPFCQCRYCRKKFGSRIPHREDWGSTKTRKYIKWLISESKKIAKCIVAAARSKNPKMTVVFNRGQFWSTTGEFSPEDNFEYAHSIADAVHTEAGIRIYDDSFEHIDEQCTFGRAIDLPIWTWVEYPLMPYSYIPSSADETLVKAAKVIANGARPMVWSMACAPLVSQQGMSGIKQIFKLVSENKECFNNIKFDKCIGIVCSSTSIIAYCRGDIDRLKDYKKSFAGAQFLAIRNHVPYDFLLDNQITANNLKSYSAIVLPNSVYLSRYQCERIQKYVKNGGCVLATYETSLYKRDGEKRNNFALCNLFGANYIKNIGDQLSNYSAGYCQFIKNHPINKNWTSNDVFPVGGKYVAVKSNDIVALLLNRCRYFCDFLQKQTPYPAIVANQYGKGRVVYIAGEFFKLYQQKGFLEYSLLFKQCLEWFTKNRMPIITNLPDTVTLSMTKNQKGHRVIHLINCSFDPTRPIKQIIPVMSKKLKIKTKDKPDTAVDITTGKSVFFKNEGGYLILSLPKLTGYNVIVVK